MKTEAPKVDITLNLEKLSKPAWMSNLCRLVELLTNLHAYILLQALTADDAPATSLPKALILIATHQTEFNMDALPTRRGRPCRTQDMADIYACICGPGRAVDKEARVLGSESRQCYSLRV